MAEQNSSINGSTGGKDHSWWILEEVDGKRITRNFTKEERKRMDYYSNREIARPVFVWMISGVEIPIMMETLFALCVLIRSRRSAPVFIIHLILSDLIQIICTLLRTYEPLKWSAKVDSAFWYSLIAGLYFMACVSVERYLLVAHPIWYKQHHSLKVCGVVSVIVWFVPLMFARLKVHWLFHSLRRSIGCFIPYPIVILCFVGTWRGLSHSISLTPLKRKLILGSLFLVLLTYTFLILPFVVVNLIPEVFPEVWGSLLFVKVVDFSKCLVYLNPLVDCILYLFLRSDAGGLMKSVHCCCRMDSHSTHSRDEHSRDSRGTFACCVSVQKPASHSQTACTSVYS